MLQVDCTRCSATYGIDEPLPARGVKAVCPSCGAAAVLKPGPDGVPGITGEATVRRASAEAKPSAPPPPPPPKAGSPPPLRPPPVPRAPAPPPKPPPARAAAAAALPDEPLAPPKKAEPAPVVDPFGAPAAKPLPRPEPPTNPSARPLAPYETFVSTRTPPPVLGSAPATASRPAAEDPFPDEKPAPGPAAAARPALAPAKEARRPPPAKRPEPPAEPAKPASTTKPFGSRQAPLAKSGKEKGRALRAAGLAVIVLAALGGAGAGARYWWLHRPPPAPAPVQRTPLELAVAAWRAHGVKPAASAAAAVAAGRADLAADMPVRTLAARHRFQEALAADPGRFDALAGWIAAFARSAGSEPPADELREAHRLAEWGLGKAPDDAALLAARAELLAVVPSSQNLADALAAARRAESLAPRDPEPLLAEARARLEQDPATALTPVDAALALAPQHRRALTLRARVLARVNRPREALAAAAKRLALDKGQPEALALRADILAAQGDADAAFAAWKSWADHDPGAAAPLLGMAEVDYQLHNDAAGARALLDQARSLPCDDALGARVLAHAAALERLAGHLDAAAALCADALKRAPGSAAALFQTALTAFYRGDAAALKSAADGLGERAGPAASELMQARIDELASRIDSSVVGYRQAASAAPGDLAAQLGDAGAMARLHAGAMALELARAAESLDPADAQARRALTDFWEGPQPLVAAAGAFERLAGEQPDALATAMTAAATSYLLLGDLANAEAAARKALAADAYATRPATVLAEVALARGRPADALRLTQGALANEGGDAVALEVRARTFEALRRPDDALAAHRAALDQNPALVTARVREAMLLLRQGDAAGARARLEKLVAADPQAAAAKKALLQLP